jgi:hypothetical protein
MKKPHIDLNVLVICLTMVLAGCVESGSLKKQSSSKSRTNITGIDLNEEKAAGNVVNNSGSNGTSIASTDYSKDPDGPIVEPPKKFDYPSNSKCSDFTSKVDFRRFNKLGKYLFENIEEVENFILDKTPTDPAKISSANLTFSWYPSGVEGPDKPRLIMNGNSIMSLNGARLPGPWSDIEPENLMYTVFSGDHYDCTITPTLRVSLRSDNGTLINRSAFKMTAKITDARGWRDDLIGPDHIYGFAWFNLNKITTEKIFTHFNNFTGNILSKDDQGNEIAKVPLLLDICSFDSETTPCAPSSPGFIQRMPVPDFQFYNKIGSRTTLSLCENENTDPKSVLKGRCQL